MDEVSALKVIKLLHDYYKDSSETLASVDAPKSIQYASNEWLIYMFYSCLLDYGTRSKIYHKNLNITYDKYPYIFNPQYVCTNYNDKPDELLKIMKENIHPRYPNVALNKWLNLSNVLSEYSSLKDELIKMNLSELESFIKGIGGYGQKTGGLLIRLIVEAKIINDDKDLNFIPIDRHDMEISYLNKITQKRELNEEEIRKLSDILIKSGKQVGAYAGTVDKYLWNVGDTFCNKKECNNCPLKSTCISKIRSE